MLCGKCRSLGDGPAVLWQTIMSERGKSGFGVPHYETAKALQESATNGCHLCSLAWAALTEPRERLPPLDKEILFFIWRDQSLDFFTGDRRDECRIDVHCGGIDSTVVGHLRQLAVVPESADSHGDETTASADDTHTGSDVSLRSIRYWMESCAKAHEKCQRSLKSRPPLPTRVIEVGDGSSVACRLVSGLAKKDDYITLSHCWGKHQPLTTTFATLESRRSCIADSDLPQTFRDAVTVCRALGVKYLWIDSLCIIQDSQQDWQAESATMGDVYSNSTLTIAATSAEDSRQGLFTSRNGLAVRPCLVSIFSVRCLISLHPNLTEEVFGEFNLLERSHLESRAWVLQEQVLACRTVSFTNNGVYWNCATLRLSEKHPLGLPGIPQEAMDYKSKLQGIINGTGLYDGLPKKDAYGFWYRSVMNFTHRNLSRESDKFPALSGLARKFAQSVRDEYIAGLWKSDLHIGLLWKISSHISPELRRSQRTQEYRAPSWSWACMACFVDYVHVVPSLDIPERILVNHKLDIVDVRDSHPQGQDSFGEVSDATLKIRAPLIAVRVKGEEVLQVDNDQDMHGHDPSSVEGQSNKDDMSLGTFYRDEWNWDAKFCFCIPVAEVMSIYEHHKNLILWCLLLERKIETPSTFSRVGLCSLTEGRENVFAEKTADEFTLV